MRKLLLIAVALIFSPLPAVAVPVTMSVEPWKTVDGNFGFSVIHAATGGHMEMDGLDFYAGGAIQYEFSSPTQYLNADLTGDVLKISGSTLSLDGASFHVADSILDFGVAEGELIGSIGYRLEDGQFTEVGSFYFYNFDYTNGTCDANGLCTNGDYRLWGNNWDAGNPLHQSFANRRGIDLGGTISAAVPEPSAALLFGMGTLIVGQATRRR